MARIAAVSLAILFAAQAIEQEGTISVTVQKTKANGKAWDAFGGAPDLSICVKTGHGIKCYPDGDSPMGIIKPACRDSFKCSFSNVYLGRGVVEITVVDVDIAANDTVGKGQCQRGKTCTIGLATVRIR